MKKRRNLKKRMSLGHHVHVQTENLEIETQHLRP
jgi:hypothetical protein